MANLPQPAQPSAAQRQHAAPSRPATRSKAAAFKQLFGSSPYFAFCIDERGHILAINDHASRLLGPLAEQAPAASLYAVWSLPMLQNEALPTARMRGYWRGEVELVGADGSSHPVTQIIEWHAAAQPPAFLCQAYPLDDYDVYESRLRFKYLFEAHPQPMWVYDLETLRFLVVNAAAVDTYGYTEAEFLHMTIRDIRPPEDLERLDDNLAAAPRKGAEQAGVWTHVKRNGERMEVEVSSHSVTLSGRPGRLVIAHDITRRLDLEADLHASRELKQLVINHIPHQIFWKGLDGAYLGCNTVFARFAGLESNADVVGRRDQDFHWGHNAEAILAEDRAIIASGQPKLNYEAHLTQPDGTVRWYVVNKLPFHDQYGNTAGIVGTIEDITERKQAELALQLRGRALAASVNAIVITAHTQDGELIEYANPAFARLFGHAAEAVLGQRLEVLLNQQSRDKQEALTSAMRTRKDVTLMLRTRHRDGAQLWTQLHVAPVRSPDGSIGHHVCVLTDMTAIIDYQAQLEHQANHDGLTGLPNRALLRDRMAQAMTFSQRFNHSMWLVFIDLDNFKLINDHLGHHAGDQLLCAIANRLGACVTEGDTVVRLGGDEFVLLLPVADLRPLASVLQLVREAVATPVEVAGQELTVTCSVGVSVYPDDGSEPEQLLKHADIALYRAKEAGRNQIQFYESTMHGRVAERALIEVELRQALARDQLSLVYQPKADLDSGVVTGVEALLRWRHPTLGMVSPARFIGVAEETGLIVSIGRWVLRTACAQVQAWQQAGLPPLRVAVNLSVRQFHDHSLIDEVRAALEDSGLDPQYLELELTESLMMHNVEEAVTAIASLKQLGIALSIDDFGTGYSSLAYLKQFPVDYLKIDQSFVREMLEEPKVAAIVRSVIALGHSLGFKIIAEGVETAEQLAYLRRNLCDEIQGYYFSRPIAPDALAELLRAGRSLPLD